MTILNRLLLRWLTQDRGQTLLCVGGIAAGVTLFLAVQIAVESSERSFLESTELVYGKAHGYLSAGIQGVPASTYRELRSDNPDIFFAPVIEAAGSVNGLNTTLIGIDPISDGPFRSYIFSGDNPTENLWQKNSILAWASSGLKLHEPVTFLTETKTLSLKVGQLLESSGDSPSFRYLLVTDIAIADSLLDRNGALSRIDLRWRGDYDEARVQAFVQTLPPGVQWKSSGSKQNSAQQMTKAFRINLLAMSLLALLVGGFLIYNSISFTVVKRRISLGQLRYLGVTPAEITRLIVAEAGILGFLGSILGIVLGATLGYLLLDIVGGTVNALYYSTGEVFFFLPWYYLGASFLLGIGISALAAAIPAIKAGHQQPVLQLSRSNEETTAKKTRVWFVLGALLAQLLSYWLIYSFPANLWLTFSGVFLGLVSVAMIIPALLETLLFLLSKLSSRAPFLVRAALLFARQSLSRTGPAVAALALALSIAISVTLMIQSFRGTLIGWLENTLKADLYITVANQLSSRAQAKFEPKVEQDLLALPGARGLSKYRSFQIETEQGAYFLIVLDLYSEGKKSFKILEGRENQPWSSWCQNNEIIVSEPFANRYKLQVNDSWKLLSSSGTTAFQVSAIFQDFATEQGAILMCREIYLKHWDDQSLNSLAYYLHPETDAEKMIQSIEAISSAASPLSIQENSKIKKTSLEIFDRTFQITYVLKIMAMIVAIVAVFGSLLALLIEIQQESSMLRVLGLQSRELSFFMILQSLFLGLCAGLFAMPMGIYMGGLLVEVINLRSFGWSLDYAWSWYDSLDSVYLGLISAGLASLIPAIKQGKLKISSFLRQ